MDIRAFAKKKPGLLIGLGVLIVAALLPQFFNKRISSPFW